MLRQSQFSACVPNSTFAMKIRHVHEENPEFRKDSQADHGFLRALHMKVKRDRPRHFLPFP